MTSARTLPLWLSPAMEAEPLPPLEGSIVADVCVVGAGIAGLTTALCLLRSGHSVVVLDRAGIGGGETLRTSAHLASALDDRFHRLERWHGEDGAQLAAQSHAAAIDWIEALVSEHGIDCSFVRTDGYLFGESEDSTRELQREYEAALRAGLAVDWLESGLPDLASPGPALRFPRQAQFHPARYLFALADVLRSKGGRLFQAEIDSVEASGGSVRLHARNGAMVEAGAAVLATNVPFHERVPIHTKQAPYRTFVIAAPIARDALPDALFWDTADPYHYVRCADPTPGATNWKYVIVGGEDHKTGQPDPQQQPYDALLAWARAKLPAIGQVAYAWSGQVLEPVDGVAHIGRDPGGEDNVYVITGDSGNGLTHGTLAGPLIAGLIDTGVHPWADLYDPRRKPFRGAGGWLHENINVALQYRDWLASGAAESLAELGREQGAIIRHGLHRVAAYRDGNGVIHSYSARCPHLGCAVRWNGRERSWDCPCHGSRFDPVDGRVLNGPAATGLSPLAAERDEAA